MKNKILGSILGLAVGDALGAPVEFLKRDSFPYVNSMRAGGPFNLKKGQWTDDTSLALCIATSLIEQKNFDPADIMKRFLKWYREGYLSCTGHCFDIGNTTKASITRYETTGVVFAGKPEDSPANGSIMRLAPIPLFFRDDLNLALHNAALSSKLTHGSPLAIDACLALTFLINRALHFKTKEEVLSYRKGDLSLHAEIEEILMGSYRHKTREQISSDGLAKNCLESALYAFYHSLNFDEGVMLAVNLGDDSDTTGAVFGQLAGAFYGVENINANFLSDLWDREFLEEVALKLYGK